MIKDYADKHWLEIMRGRQNVSQWAEDSPDYNNHDPHFPRKLADAIEWLRQQQMWRGEANCRHVYRNADGKRTEK